jgi:hypothetical protein
MSHLARGPASAGIDSKAIAARRRHTDVRVLENLEEAVA